MEPPLRRGQIAVYAGLGVILLLLGIKAVRGDQAPTAGAGESGVRIEGSVAGRDGGDAGQMVVHVAGAVRKPGVYRLPAGSRVEQALQRAGGAEPGAQADAINLAAQISDGQQIVVPGRGAAGALTATGGADGPISLGTAGAADLEAIDGIGPVTAEKIIQFRDENGGLGSVAELDAIPGIGPATMESLSARLQP